MSPDYSIGVARYAKGQRIIRTRHEGIFKTRAARLASGLRGRWTNREAGYVVSPTKAERFERLYAEGWDASPITGKLIAPPNAIAI